RDLLNKLCVNFGSDRADKKPRKAGVPHPTRRFERRHVPSVKFAGKLASVLASRSKLEICGKRCLIGLVPREIWQPNRGVVTLHMPVIEKGTRCDFLVRRHVFSDP